MAQLRRSAHWILVPLALLGSACSSGSSSSTGNGGTQGTGGVPSQGGTAGSGGNVQTGTGGQTGGGGSINPATGGVGAAGQPGSGDAGTSDSAGGTTGTGSGGNAGAGGAPDSGSGVVGAADAGGGSVMRSAGCDKTRTLQDGTVTIQSNGARTYILRTPDNYDNTHPYRLILAYHWSGANASDVANSNYFRHWTMANNTTIFVAPEGLDSGWANMNGQDVTFTDAILAQVEDDLCVDTTRVFATGFSFGGGMCIALACARPNVFRAVAFFSGAELSGCDGGTMPIAYYASQASQDHGSLPADSPIAGEVFQAKFAALNGCTAQDAPIPATGSGQPHICTNYKGCSAGHPTEYCGFDGPHGWDPKDPGQMMGWDPEEAWKFITQF